MWRPATPGRIIGVHSSVFVCVVAGNRSHVTLRRPRGIPILPPRRAIAVLRAAVFSRAADILQACRADSPSFSCRPRARSPCGGVGDPLTVVQGRARRAVTARKRSRPARDVMAASRYAGFRPASDACGSSRALGMMVRHAHPGVRCPSARWNPMLVSSRESSVARGWLRVESVFWFGARSRSESMDRSSCGCDRLRGRVIV